MIAVDTNVLVHAHREEMPLHKKALSRLTQLAEATQPWALPVFCVGEFARVVTHPRVFDPPTTLDKALAFLDSLLGSPSLRVLMPGERYLELFAEACRQGNVRGNLVFDGQIAGLLWEHGVEEILTEDRDFARFKKLKVTPLTSG